MMKDCSNAPTHPACQLPAGKSALTSRTAHPVWVGTCGWSYPDWRGVEYPESLRPTQFLEHYARHYPAVEVDSTYYRAPSPRMVETWRRATPEDFRFSLKVPRSITHEKLLQNCEAERDAFVAAIEVLGERLCCCLLQLGYLNRSAFSGLPAFLKTLEAFLKGWPVHVPLALEIRNRSWAGREFAEVLRQFGAVWALSDQVWMPPPLELVHHIDAVTGSFAYLRLLGDREAVDAKTDRLDRLVLNREAELQRDAEAARLLATRVPVLVFVNNHFAGHAPATVRQFRSMMEDAGSSRPGERKEADGA